MENSTKVSTGKVDPKSLLRFSYVNIEKAKAAPGSTRETFGLSVIVPKTHKKIIRALEDAIAAAEEAGRDKFGKAWKSKKTPLRDGDKERDDAAYADSIFFNANSATRPGLVDKNVEIITDLKEIKSGDWGHVSVNFYPFSVGGNMGVAAGINHIQKVKDGEALGGGRTNAEDEFDEIEFEEDDIM